MIGKKVVKEKVLSLAEVADMLNSLENLNDYQKLALDYAEKYAKLELSKAKQLKKKILELGYDEKVAAKIVDILPKDADDVRIIFARERYKLKQEDINKILEAVNSVLKSS